MIPRKYILTGLITFTLICVLYFLLVMYPRIGKIPVEILVNPGDAIVYINGSKASPGIHYLKQGSYSLRAEKSGWVTDETTVTISDKLTSVALLPRPESETAKQQAKDEASVREELSSIAANARGLDIRNSYPIINKLPYSDISGPFKIDYGFNQDDKKTPYLIISFSTPNGRSEAIDWLKSNKVDLTTTEIIFEDFESPVYKLEDPHEAE